MEVSPHHCGISDTDTEGRAMRKLRKQKPMAAKAGKRPAAPDPWVTLLQAAAITGKHRQTVLTLALERGLTVDRRAGMTFFRRDEIETLRDSLAAEQAAKLAA
jgi:hypothetical protein